MRETDKKQTKTQSNVREDDGDQGKGAGKSHGVGPCQTGMAVHLLNQWSPHVLDHVPL